MYSRGVCLACPSNRAFCVRIHGILVAIRVRIASSFRCKGEDTRTLPSGGKTARCRFLIDLRTTNTSMVPICKRQELVLMLILDDFKEGFKPVRRLRQHLADLYLNFSFF